MKHRWLMLVLALALVAGLAGCGGQRGTVPTQAPETQAPETQGPSAEPTPEPAADGREPAELGETVMAEVETAISDLKAEYTGLKEEIPTYDDYLDNTAKMEEFYGNTLESTGSLCAKLRQHSAAYAEAVLSSDKSCNEKADDLGELFDCVYDDAGDEIFDEIYGGILQEAFDDFYGGILEDASDQGEYQEWFDARSEEYDRWSDTRSNVYEVWSDFRSDIYDLWADLRGELWSDDEEKAWEVLEEFNQKMMSGASGDVPSEPVETSAAPSSETPEEIPPSQEPVESAAPDGAEAGIRPEFQEAMDAYEAFYDEYCDVMKKYSENPTDPDLLIAYTNMLAKSAEMAQAFEKWGDEELSEAELKYYIEVNNRVTQKLLEVAG